MDFTQIKETCIYVKDLEVTRDFYSTTLDLPVISFVEGKHVFFRAGSSVLLCFNPEDSKNKTSPPGHYAEGKIHFAFEVDPKDYQPWKDKIIDANVKVIDKVTWKSGQESFYFEDPDGHILEIVPKGVWEYPK